MSPMTMKQRMLAVLQGRMPDRVPFCQYSGLSAPNEAVWSLLGRENFGLIRWTRVHVFEHPNCRFEQIPFERNGLNGLKTILHTPIGNLTEEKLYDPTYGSEAVSSHFIKDLPDYRVFMYYLRDISVRENTSALIQNINELGEDGLPMVAVERTPYQQLWVVWVSLEDLCLHLSDAPELLEECMTLLGDIERKIFHVVRQVAQTLPVAYVNIPDNITAPAIGEKYFRKYCLPYYQELSAMMAEKDIPVAVHMDGDLKPLWSAIGESKIQAMDSFSPPPDNDTSAEEVVRMWPQMKMLLNFPSSIHLAQSDIIYDHAMKILNQAGGTGRLWIQISENVPPTVWQKSFPVIKKTIEDFGNPQK